jgi:hypothetical protein
MAWPGGEFQMVLMKYAALTIIWLLDSVHCLLFRNKYSEIIDNFTLWPHQFTKKELPVFIKVGGHLIP